MAMLVVVVVIIIVIIMIMVVVITTAVCPRGLPFSWWGCYGLCLKHKPIEFAHSFILFLCLFLPL